MQDDIRRKASTDTQPDPGGPLDPPEDDDDNTGEMESAEQDLGLVVEEEREASSVEDSGLEDEEADWIDHDDDTDKGRGLAD